MPMRPAYKDHVREDCSRTGEIDPNPSLPFQVDRDQRIEQDSDANEQDAPSRSERLPGEACLSKCPARDACGDAVKA